MNAQEHLKVLQTITAAVLSRRDLAGFFESVAKAIQEIFPNIDEFALHRYKAEERAFEVVATTKKENLGIRFSDEELTPGGFMLKVKRTIMANDVNAFEMQSGVPLRKFYRTTWNSGIDSPLIHGQQLLGFMSMKSNKPGAFDLEHKELVDLIGGVIGLGFENALAFSDLQHSREAAEAQGEYFREVAESAYPVNGVVGKSRYFKLILRQIEQVAPTDSTVLIQGETGTGKEVIARAIHERSLRAKKPLIKLNCGALPENLVESELFGHERGSFTGAQNKRIGRFELADGGTIFLDEIGEMPMALQVKLLRVLQEQEFERVGGEKPIQVNVRVLAATNRDLRNEVTAGRFRADLFYRLNVFPIEVPPLRSRPEDALVLAKYFLSRTAERMGRKKLRYSERSLEVVQTYPWPGNVRELEHLVERAVILSSQDEVDVAALLMPSQPLTVAFPADRPPVTMSPSGTSTQMPLSPAFEEHVSGVLTAMSRKSTASPEEAVRDVANGKTVSLKESFLEAERTAIETALSECGGVIGGKNGAAARLGLKRQTLQSKMKKLGISITKSGRSSTTVEEDDEE